MTTQTAARVTVPELPLTGGCQCGAVRYRVNSMPLAFYLCHCTKCQSQSGSAFGESLQVQLSDLEIEGETGSFVRATDSGRQLEGRFCKNCGTRILHAIVGPSTAGNLRAGTLDDTSWLAPAAHLWVSSAQQWFAIPEGALAYETQPGDLEPIRARWRQMICQSD